MGKLPSPVILVLVSSLLVAAWPRETAALEPRPLRTALASPLNALRALEGLAALDVDVANSERLDRVLGESANEGAGDSLTRAQRCQVLGTIPDWDVTCEMASGSSEDALVNGLLASPEFLSALLRPEVSHIALGVREQPNGDMLCAACIVRRLVTLDSYTVTLVHGGGTFVTVLGTSSYKHVRVRLYTSEESPETYEGDDHVVDLVTDDAGRFDVRLNLSRYGYGVYRVIIYVEDEHGNYVIAAHRRAKAALW